MSNLQTNMHVPVANATAQIFQFFFVSDPSTLSKINDDPKDLFSMWIIISTDIYCIRKLKQKFLNINSLK